MFVRNSIPLPRFFNLEMLRNETAKKRSAAWYQSRRGFVSLSFTFVLATKHQKPEPKPLNRGRSPLRRLTRQVLYPPPSAGPSLPAMELSCRVRWLTKCPLNDPRGNFPKQFLIIFTNLWFLRASGGRKEGGGGGSLQPHSVAVSCGVGAIKSR